MAAGYRRWVLYPELGYISYGQVMGTAIQKTFGFGMEPIETRSPELEMVAFPYLTYPYMLVEKGGKPTPWSISMVPYGGDNNAFDYFSNV